MRNHFLLKTMRLFVIVILVVSAGVINATAETAQPAPVRLKVVALPYLSFAPFFIAQEEGYFTEQGIEVEFVKMESMAQTIPLLLQRQIDVTSGSINMSVFNQKDIERFRGHFPRTCRLVHGLSATETGRIAQMIIEPQTQCEDRSIVPVGYPRPETDIFLLNEEGQAVPPQAIGHIAVRSRYLSPGYWNDPELTRQKFLCLYSVAVSRQISP